MLGPSAGPDHLTISHQLRLHIVMITYDSRVMISTSPHDVKICRYCAGDIVDRAVLQVNENKFI
jgi:hypothetical protein